MQRETSAECTRSTPRPTDGRSGGGRAYNIYIYIHTLTCVYITYIYIHMRTCTYLHTYTFCSFRSFRFVDHGRASRGVSSWGCSQYQRPCFILPYGFRLLACVVASSTTRWCYGARQYLLGIQGFRVTYARGLLWFSRPPPAAETPNEDPTA